jgi:formate hydrogenlyase subunit 3/multisubunit Na+/H+ antiporter MnhD subunit
LRGLGTRQPLTAATLALGTVSILALPPSGGFAAKWLLLSAALQAGAWWWVAVMLAGGLLAAGYSFRVLERIVSPGPDESPAPAPAAMAFPAFALAVAALALGMAPWLPLELLAAAPPLAGLGGGAP